MRFTPEDLRQIHQLIYKAVISTGSDVSLASLAASNAYTFPLSSFNTSLQRVVTLPALKAAIKSGIDKVSGEIEFLLFRQKET